jgi:hypothetical protein
VRVAADPWHARFVIKACEKSASIHQ